MPPNKPDKPLNILAGTETTSGVEAGNTVLTSLLTFWNAEPIPLTIC
ncbi:MAG: hypothetical protein QXU98_14290 [Candidatus Parvarchaeota archaeon]